MGDSVGYIRWARRNNPELIAQNMAYHILMEHSPCFADDVPLDGLADSIAAAILKGAVPAGEPEPAK